MFRILSQLDFGPFLRRDLVFGEISVTGCAILTLSGRKPACMPTRFDGWPIFATDFAARGEIADRFLLFG